MRFKLCLLLLIAFELVACASSDSDIMRITISGIDYPDYPVIQFLNISQVGDFSPGDCQLLSYSQPLDLDVNGNVDTWVIPASPSSIKPTNSSYFSFSNLTLKYGDKFAFQKAGPCFIYNGVEGCSFTSEPFYTEEIQNYFYNWDLNTSITIFGLKSINQSNHQTSVTCTSNVTQTNVVLENITCVRVFNLERISNTYIIQNFRKQQTELNLNGINITAPFTIQNSNFGNALAYLFLSENFTYVFFNVANDSFVLRSQINHDSIFQCPSTTLRPRKNFDLILYTFFQPKNESLLLQTVANELSSIFSPPQLVKIERNMIDYIEFTSLDFTPELRDLNEGDAVSDITFVIKIKPSYSDLIRSKNQKVESLSYVRYDNGDVGLSNYNQNNGYFEINVSNYHLNVTTLPSPFDKYFAISPMWAYPLEKYYATFTFQDNVSLENVSAKPRSINPQKGFTTAARVEKNKISFISMRNPVSLLFMYGLPVFILLLVFFYRKWFSPTDMHLLGGSLLAIFTLLIQAFSGLIKIEYGVTFGLISSFLFTVMFILIWFFISARKKVRS